MLDPDSPEFQRNSEAMRNPFEQAIMDRTYTPGIVSWMSNVERAHTIESIMNMSDDVEWQKAAVAGIDRSRGYEDTALTRLYEAGITIPTDDPEYMQIVERQMAETVERL